MLYFSGYHTGKDTAIKRLPLLYATLSLCASLLAADADRAGTWELYLGPQYIDGQTVKFDHGSEADINDMASLMYGFGYNFDNHMSLGMLFNSSSSNYTGTAIDSNGDPKTYSATMYSSSMNAAFTYNLLEGDFTPYVLGNIGLTYIDSGIPNGLSTGCYWLPWYGYVCGNYITSYTSTRFNYGAQLGVRYDMSEALFFRAGLGLNVIDLSGIPNPDFTIYNFAVGFKFK